MSIPERPADWRGKDTDWHPDTLELPPQVLATRRAFQSTSRDTLVANMASDLSVYPPEIDEFTGVGMAVFSREGDSTTEAVVTINPLSCDVSLERPKPLAYGYFTWLSLRDTEPMADMAGNNKPLVVLSAPAHESSVHARGGKVVQKRLWEATNEGNFALMAKVYLETVRNRLGKGLGRMAVSGQSLGGMIAPELAQCAKVRGVDVTHVGSGQPVNVANRLRLDMLGALGSQDAPTKRVIEEAGIPAITQMHAEESLPGLVRAIAPQFRANWEILAGSCRPTLSDSLILAALSGARTTVGHSTTDPMSPRTHMDAQIKRARQCFLPDAPDEDTHPPLNLREGNFHGIDKITIHGKPHNWANDPSLGAAFVHAVLGRE